MRKGILVTILVLLMCPASADAKGFRVLKGQQKDIAKFERTVAKSKLHPKAKRKVLNAIGRAKSQLGSSDYAHRRVYTDVNRNGGTLVFDTGPQRSITVRFSGKEGGDVEMFQYFKSSRATFRARALSPALTLTYRGGTKEEGGVYRQKDTYTVQTTKRTRDTVVSRRLWRKLNHSPSDRRALTPKLQVKMQSSPRPRGLDYKWSGIRTANALPRTITSTD